MGFGDFVPISDSERLLCCIFLLFGVAIYSYIGSIYALMITRITHFNKSFNDSPRLQRFFDVFKKFNSGKMINS